LLLVAIVIGFAVIVYAFGLVWFMILTERSFAESALATTVPFLPGDAIKAAAVILAYPAIVKLRNK